MIQKGQAASRSRWQRSSENQEGNRGQRLLAFAREEPKPVPNRGDDRSVPTKNKKASANSEGDQSAFPASGGAPHPPGPGWQTKEVPSSQIALSQAADVTVRIFWPSWPARCCLACFIFRFVRPAQHHSFWAFMICEA